VRVTDAFGLGVPGKAVSATLVGADGGVLKAGNCGLALAAGDACASAKCDCVPALPGSTAETDGFFSSHATGQGAVYTAVNVYVKAGTTLPDHVPSPPPPLCFPSRFGPQKGVLRTQETFSIGSRCGDCRFSPANTLGGPEPRART
jgi:hypothetical protein